MSASVALLAASVQSVGRAAPMALHSDNPHVFLFRALRRCLSRVPSAFADSQPRNGRTDRSGCPPHERRRGVRGLARGRAGHRPPGAAILAQPEDREGVARELPRQALARQALDARGGHHSVRSISGVPCIAFAR